MSKFKTVSEDQLGIYQEVEDLCESFSLSCKYNGVKEDDFQYYKRYVFFLLTILKAKLTVVEGKRKPAKKTKAKTKGVKK